MAKRFSNIRLVTFDLFDTLYTPSEPIAITYARPLWNQGIEIQSDKIGSSFSKAIKQTRAEYPNYGYRKGLTSQQWWRLVIERTWSDSGIKDIANQYPRLLNERDLLIERFNTDQGYTMYPEVPKVLKYLRRKEIKLGVISNMDEAADNILKCLGIRDSFDFVLKSITVGIEKPDPRIFQKALSAVNIPAYDALHIGDNERLDYLAAKSVGIEALVVDRSGEKAKLSGNSD
ncbi:hypothetical protein GGI12_005256, partial [Dipsacomyces acuminosporus]